MPDSSLITVEFSRDSNVRYCFFFFFLPSKDILQLNQTHKKREVNDIYVHMCACACVCPRLLIRGGGDKSRVEP